VCLAIEGRDPSKAERTVRAQRPGEKLQPLCGRRNRKNGPVGRSSLLTDELRGRLERELATGATVPVVCQNTGVKVRTLESWLAAGKVVRRQLEAVPAPDPVPELGEAELIALIDAAAERGQWHAAAWLLERRWPERWMRPSSRPASPTEPEIPDRFLEILKQPPRRPS
jgi:transposase